MNALRKVFWFLNRFFMVPAFRLGLAYFICNPIFGYIMVIKNTGRKSGKLYHTPTNYAIINGYVYCLSGFGRKAHWYLNLKANPEVEIEIGRSRMKMTARRATTDECAALWPRLMEMYRGFEGYRSRTEREIPMVILSHAAGRNLDTHVGSA